MAPLEAMSCGVPIAAADASGIPDIFEFNGTPAGIVVPRANAEALANALELLLDDSKLRHQFSKRGRRRIETHFSMEAVGFQLRGFFSERGMR